MSEGSVEKAVWECVVIWLLWTAIWPLAIPYILVKQYWKIVVLTIRDIYSDEDTLMASSMFAIFGIAPFWIVLGWVAWMWL